MSQNPNMVTIFSPEGEAFEVSGLNARDLSNHGWTYERVIAAATPTPPPAPVPQPVDTAPAPVTPPAPADETKVEETSDEGADETTDAEPKKLRLTVEDFADLDEKAEVQAYIAATFPDFKIDKRANRDKLIAQAIELATAE